MSAVDHSSSKSFLLIMFPMSLGVPGNFGQRRAEGVEDLISRYTPRVFGVKGIRWCHNG